MNVDFLIKLWKLLLKRAFSTTFIQFMLAVREKPSSIISSIFSLSISSNWAKKALNVNVKGEILLLHLLLYLPICFVWQDHLPTAFHWLSKARSQWLIYEIWLQLNHRTLLHLMHTFSLSNWHDSLIRVCNLGVFLIFEPRKEKREFKADLRQV